MSISLSSAQVLGIAEALRKRGDRAFTVSVVRFLEDLCAESPKWSKVKGPLYTESGIISADAIIAEIERELRAVEAHPAGAEKVVRGK